MSGGIVAGGLLARPAGEGTIPAPEGSDAFWPGLRWTHFFLSGVTKDSRHRHFSLFGTALKREEQLLWKGQHEPSHGPMISHGITASVFCLVLTKAGSIARCES